MSAQRTFDVIVIGGGAAGEVVAGRVSGAGHSVAIVEEDLVGGQCSYWACMPMKALLRPSSVLAEARRVPGARRAVKGDIDTDDVLAFRDRMASHWKDDDQRDWLDRHGVELIRGRARIDGERRVRVDDVMLTARRAVVIATGSLPVIPPIDGADDVDVWDNRRLVSLDEIPRHVVLIGGGAVGVEAAQAMRRLGSESVTIIEAEGQLLPGEEPFVGDELAASFADQGIDVVTGHEVKRLSARGNSIDVQISDGSSRRTEVVVSAVGRRPATADVGLATIGMEDGGYIAVDPSMRTEAHPDWLYAVGDVTGDDLFTHMGKYEARVAADHIIGHERTTDLGRTATPRIVFTDPIVVAVGMTEADAAGAGLSIETRQTSVASQALARIWGVDVGGTAKLVVDSSASVLVGATLTGPSCLAEMALAIQAAIVGQVPLDRLRHVVPQYPTFSEMWLDLLAA